MSHTPTPWRVTNAIKGNSEEMLDWGIVADCDIGPKIIAECFGQIGPRSFISAKQNAELICRAVNSHDELLEAAKEVVDCMLAYSFRGDLMMDEAQNKLKEAIKKAENK